jgi:intraflagellar transport protein 74
MLSSTYIKKTAAACSDQKYSIARGLHVFLLVLAMDRPASRGLLAGGVQKAPTGLSVEKPERPSTASRQQQQQGGPPSTAQSSRSIGTASGRGGALKPPSTAFRRVLQAGPGALASQPAAQARPMTSQQGMGGLKPSTAAAGRQVLDRTYFVNELRQKRQQIMAVIQQMQVRTAVVSPVRLQQLLSVSSPV